MQIRKTGAILATTHDKLPSGIFSLLMLLKVTYMYYITKTGKNSSPFAMHGSSWSSC